MKKVSVTLLETFRRFRDGVSEWDTEEKVIASLTEEFKGNDYTFVGQAGHYVVETKGNTTKEELFDLFGVNMNDAQIDMLRNHAIELNPFVAEVKLRKVYQTIGGEISITGMTDVIKGNHLRDNKFKFSAPKLIDYLNSCQWKFYLDIFELEHFYYDIFEFVGYGKEMERNVSLIQLVKHDEFHCVSYKVMQKDIQSILDDFISWIQYRNLQCYLKDV